MTGFENAPFLPRAVVLLQPTIPYETEVAPTCHCRSCTERLRRMYIDPGATSLLWQLIVSGIVGVGFTLRHSITRVWRKLRRFGNAE